MSIQQQNDTSVFRQSLQKSVSNNFGNYVVGDHINHGAYGHIFKLVQITTKKIYALKVLDRGQKGAQIKIKNEINIHESLKNRFILKLYNKFHDHQHFYMVLQHCQNGDLLTYMQQRCKKNKSLQFSQIQKFSQQIAKGISYLHKQQIIHGDIKPSNILINNENEIKICDFGLSTRKKNNEKINGAKGTLSYLAPESIFDYDQKVDIWAFGVVLYYMSTGLLPFQIKNYKQLTNILTQDKLRKFKYPQKINIKIKNLLKKIFVYDSHKRYSINDILKHPFITGQQLIQTTQISIVHTQIQKPSRLRSHGSSIAQKQQKIEYLKMTTQFGRQTDRYHKESDKNHKESDKHHKESDKHHKESDKNNNDKNKQLNKNMRPISQTTYRQRQYQNDRNIRQNYMGKILQNKTKLFQKNNQQDKYKNINNKQNYKQRINKQNKNQHKSNKLNKQHKQHKQIKQYKDRFINDKNRNDKQNNININNINNINTTNNKNIKQNNKITSSSVHKVHNSTKNSLKRILQQESGYESIITDRQVRKQKHSSLYNKNSNTYKTILQPLNTQYMIIKPIIQNNCITKINEQGISRYKQQYDLINSHKLIKQIRISPNGKAIFMKINQKQKFYTLQTLPQKYYKEYQNCRKVLEFVKNHTIKIKIQKKYHQPIYKQIQFNLMYSGKIIAFINNQKIQTTQKQIQQFKSIKKQLSKQDQFKKQIRSIYQKVINL